MWVEQTKLKSLIILSVHGKKLVNKCNIYRHKIKPDHIVKLAVNWKKSQGHPGEHDAVYPQWTTSWTC